MPTREDSADRIAEEAHLLDLADLQAVALWVLSAAGAGVVGNTAFEVLRGVRKRFGAQRIEALRERVYEELVAMKRRSQRQLSASELRLRVDRIFDEFDS